MNICVIGTGYVGLVQAACLAENGNTVTCIDIDPQKLQLLSNGEIPIYEPGLEELVKNNIQAKRLFFQGSMPIARMDFIFVCVGTPENKDGSPNLTYLKSAYESIVDHIKNITNNENEFYSPIVVNKSTVPVGTALDMFQYLKEELGFEIAVASNPEFLKEGTAVSDCMKPDRIIVGYVAAWDGIAGSNEDDIKAAFKKLYEPFARSREKLIFMDSTSAELTKYAANAMLMARVCIMNELADVAEKFDANIESIRKGIASDPRIGSQFLYAGPGTGGSCFIKDVQSLLHSCKNSRPYPSILSQVYESNERRMDLKPYLTIIDFYEKMQWSIKGRTFAVLGYTFKANTDDTRHSAAKPLIDKLVEAGAYVQVYDPKAKIPQQENVKYCVTLQDALLDCNAAIIMTEWNEFRNAELFTYKNLGDNILIDFRNIFSLETMAAQDTTYISVGRPVIYGRNTVDDFREN